MPTKARGSEGTLLRLPSQVGLHQDPAPGQSQLTASFTGSAWGKTAGSGYLVASGTWKSWSGVTFLGGACPPLHKSVEKTQDEASLTQVHPECCRFYVPAPRHVRKDRGSSITVYLPHVQNATGSIPSNKKKEVRGGFRIHGPHLRLATSKANLGGARPGRYAGCCGVVLGLGSVIGPYIAQAAAGSLPHCTGASDLPHLPHFPHLSLELPHLPGLPFAHLQGSGGDG